MKSIIQIKLLIFRIKSLMTTQLVLFIGIFMAYPAQASNDQLFYFEGQSASVTYQKDISDETRENLFTDTERKSDSDTEILDIRGRGWLYHPALLIFNVGLQPEFKQQQVKTNVSNSRESDSDTFGYFFDSTFLQLKPYSFKVFANRTVNHNSNSSTSDTTNDSKTFRVTTELKEIPIPTKIKFERTQRLNEGLFTTNEKRRLFQIRSTDETHDRKTSVEIQHSEIERGQANNPFDTETISLTARNHYKFKDNIDLSSGLRYSDSTSDRFDIQSASLSNNLVINHTDNFSTHYNALYRERDDELFSIVTKNASAGLNHKLYENLSTSVDVFSSENSHNNGATSSAGGSTNFNYVRKIPWGSINLNYGYRKSYENNRSESISSNVSGESITLASSTGISFLDKTQIVTNSIRVFNAARTILYTEGVDYTLTPIDNNIGIERSLFGAITDGQLVIVDYQFESNTPYKITNVGENFGASLRLWKKLRIFFDYSTNQQDLTSGVTDADLSRNFIRTIGSNLRLAWSTTRIEQQERDESTHLKRLTIAQSAQFRFNYNWSVGLGVDYAKTELIDTDEIIKGWGLSGRLGWRVSPSTRVRLTYSGRESDSIRRSSERNTAVAEMLTRYGAWDITTTYTFNDNVDEFNGQRQKRSSVLFRIKRKFKFRFR